MALQICQDPHMIFGVSPTKDAVVVVQTRGSGETFATTSITSIQFQAWSGDDLTDLRQRLISVFERAALRGAPNREWRRRRKHWGHGPSQAHGPCAPLSSIARPSGSLHPKP